MSRSSSERKAAPLAGPDPGFQIEHGEPLCAAAVRIYTTQLDDAVKHLRGADFHEGVHEARKRFKKIRALLRGVRSELGDATFDEQNGFFRDIARSVGAVRDAQSLMECVQKLKDLDDNVRSEVLLKLARRRDLLSQHEGRADAENVALKLLQHRDVGASWGLRTVGFATLHDGIAAVYSRGRKHCMHLVMHGGGTAEEFHELRKATKQMWSLLVMVVNMWLALLVPLAKEWKSLADNLGDHHDLHCLSELAASRELFLFDAEEAMRAELVHAIDAKRVALEKSILLRGNMLYALHAPAFATQLGAMWAYWQANPPTPTTPGRAVAEQ